MIFEKIEIDFIKDETGKACIVPDLRNFLPKDIARRTEFKFYVIRQLNSDGKPNDLYLKNVSPLRSETQNAISKYKFQSLNTSFDSFNTDSYLVRLQPGDKLDMPEYTKNQKEYACFENLRDGKAEIVAVLKSIPIEEREKPEAFEAVYTDKDNKERNVQPEILEDGVLFYHEVQDEINKLLSELPEDNLTTQYAFCGGLPIAKFSSKKEYRPAINVAEKQITDSAHSYRINIIVTDNQEISSMISSSAFIGKAKGEKFWKKLSAKTFSNSGIDFKITKAFLDKECTVPLDNKFNISPKFDPITIYTKVEYIDAIRYYGNFTFESIIGDKVTLDLKPFDKGTVPKDKIEELYRQRLRMKSFSSFEIRNKVTKEVLNDLPIKDIVSGRYEIEYHNPVTVDFKPFNTKVTFDFFDPRGAFGLKGAYSSRDEHFAADITEYVKSTEKVSSYFSIDTEIDIFTIKQLDEDKIFLVYRPLRSEALSEKNTDYAARLISYASKPGIRGMGLAPISLDSGLDFLIVDKDTRIILERYHANCEIKRMFTENYKAQASSNYTLFVTKVDLSELEKKYEICSQFSSTTTPTAKVACCKNGKNSVGARLEIDYDWTNLPCYRSYYQYPCFGGGEYYVPKAVYEAKGEELSFWYPDKTADYLLCIFVKEKK